MKSGVISRTRTKNVGRAEGGGKEKVVAVARITGVGENFSSVLCMTTSHSTESRKKIKFHSFDLGSEIFPKKA